MTDEELAAIAITFGKVSDDTKFGRPPGGTRKLHAVICAILLVASIALTLLEPARPESLPSLTPMVAAIAIACGFGPRMGWAVFGGAALWLAWTVPPINSLLIDADYLPWFFEVLIAWLAIPGIAMGYRRG